MSLGSFGGRIELDIVGTGTDVAAQVNEQLERMAANGRAATDMWRDGSINGAQFVTVLSQIAAATNKLEKAHAAYQVTATAAMRDSKQAAIDLAAVMDNLARKEERDSLERIRLIMETAEAKKKADAEEKQSAADLQMVRENLARKLEKDSRDQMRLILDGIEIRKKADAEEKQSAADLAEVRATLSAMQERDAKERIEQTQREIEAANQAKEALKSEFAAIGAGQEVVTKATIAKAQLEAATRAATKAETEWAQTVAAEVTVQNELARAEREHKVAMDNLREASLASIATNGSSVAVEQQLFAAEQAVIGSEENLASIRQRLASATQARADKAVIASDADQRLNDATKNVVASTDAEAASLHRAGAAATQKANSVQNANDQSIRFARSIYYASQGLQDLEYGFSAVVNNIPLFVMEMSRAMGMSSQFAMQLSAGIAIGATIVDVLLPKAIAVFREFAMADADKMYQSVGRIEQRLKDMTSHAWFVTVDYRQVEELEERLRRAKAAKSAYDAANSAQTEEQQEAGRRVQHALVESAGGTDAESGTANVKKAIGEYRDAHRDQFKDDELVQKQIKLEQEIKDRKKMIDSTTDPDVQYAQSVLLKAKQDELEKTKQSISARDQERIGMASMGNEGEIARIQRMMESDPAFFAQRGIGEQFRTEIGGARRGEVKRDLAEGNHDPAWKSQRDKARKEEKDWRDWTKQDDKEKADEEKSYADRDKADLKEKKDGEKAGRQADKDTKKVEADAEKIRLQKIHEQAKEDKQVAHFAKIDADNLAKQAHEGGKGMLTGLEGFALQQQMGRNQVDELRKTPEGREQIRLALEADKQHRQEVQRKIAARNRDAAFKKKYGKMSDLEKEDLALQDEQAMFGQMPLTEESERRFRNRRAANDLERGGVASNPRDAAQMAKVVNQEADKALSDKMAGFISTSGSLQEAQLKMMTSLMGVIETGQLRQQRQANMLNQLYQRMADTRQTNMDW